MGAKCRQKVSLLPPSGPRVASLLAEIRLRVPNYLICMVLWSIEQWFVGAESRFLPVLRETPGGRRGVAV